TVSRSRRLGRQPGTEFLDGETGRQKPPIKCANACGDQDPGIEWPEMPGRSALFDVVPETRGLQGLGGGVRSQIRTGLRGQFPANREINREFCDFGPSEANFVARNRCAAATSREIPYAD